MKAQRGSRGVVNASLRPLCPRQRPVPTVTAVRWAPEPDCMGAKNLALDRDYFLLNHDSTVQIKHNGLSNQSDIFPWFDPRTIQPVASHYTNWVIMAHERLDDDF
jgi:hypothetical protein